MDQPEHVAQPKPSSTSPQLTPVTTTNRLQHPGPLCAGVQIPTKGMGFKKRSHQQQTPRGKEQDEERDEVLWDRSRDPSF